MNPRRTPRARRVPVPPDQPVVMEGATYTRTYEIRMDGSQGLSAEAWARACFEGAPVVVRTVLVLGWTAVLRLRLGSRGSPDHVLGWQVRSRTPSTVVLELDGPLITARKMLGVADGLLTATTAVRVHRRAGRIAWAMAVPVHHLTEPLLLTLAARRTARCSG